MKNRFEGKVILITGGNSGIGLATAHRLVDEGATVIITGRDSGTLAKSVEKLGKTATGIVADVSRISEIESLYHQIKKQFGHLDGVFANAGIAIMAPVENISEEIFDKLINTNVKGVFFTLQKAIPLLKEDSAMVINASAADIKGGEMTSVYAATKAAVRSLARTFSGEFIGRGIRVNVVSPGPIETPIWTRPDGIPKETLPSIADRVKTTNPSKRYGKPEEVAATVAFLLSGESSYIVGAEIYVDGGSGQI